MKYIPIENSSQVDLTRHSLIEASAGTGKTYTIENLVVRLLQEREDLQLENILLVTFTEKATSELKIRIRQKLANTLSETSGDPSAAGRIGEALDHFETASIYTIHGFCNTVLHDFAFENQSLFDSELVSDGGIMDAAFKEQMRKEWPRRYGDHFKLVLQVAGFPAGRSAFAATVTRIAGGVFRPEYGDRLLPNIGSRTIAEIIAEMALLVEDLRKIVGKPPSFSNGYQKLHIHGAVKTSLLQKIILPLEAFLDQQWPDDGWLEALLHLVLKIRQTGSKGREGVDCLDIDPADWLKKGANPEACPHLLAVQSTLKQLSDTHTCLAFKLAGDTIETLRCDVREVKKKNGWLSFADMLERVENALNGEHAELLLTRLRQKFRIAFVDEFQDTDPVQWRIFRKIFIGDSQNPAGDNRLTIIGDPKQAIYSFRGADVYAYLAARNEMEQLACSGRAHLYSLSRNWRSTADLVACFNRLFKGDHWFAAMERATGFEIGYADITAPGDMHLPETVVSDDSSRLSLNAVDLQSCHNSQGAKTVLAEFIAREILFLVRKGGIRIRNRDGWERPLDMGDIAILVRGRNDSPTLEAVLRGSGIPVSFYKKPGLFQSVEATCLSWVFRAIRDPADSSTVKRALLTPFFNLKPTDLMEHPVFPREHPASRLLFAWNAYAEARNWGCLFQSLQEDSGLVFRSCAERDWDRMQTGYHQILFYLTNAAYRKNLDFDSLCALLDGLRLESAVADDEGNIHQIETEEHKVRIMTMHASKGLQFPVVFVAGGLTQNNQEAFHTYHQIGSSQAGIPEKIIDLSKRADPEQHARERLGEEQRLLYVALTRAQFKLYVPFWPLDSAQSWAGPARRFLADGLYLRFSGKDDPVRIGWLDPFGDGSPVSASAGDAIVQQDETVGKAVLAEFPRVRNFSARKIRMESFSSIHRSAPLPVAAQKPDAMFPIGREQAREADEGFNVDPLSKQPAVIREDELPGGADVGSMFHEILEHIDFKSVAENPQKVFQQPQTAELITARMQQYGVDPNWRRAVVSIVRNTLLAEIFGENDPFTIGTIPKRDRVPEAEFYFPLNGEYSEMQEIPECRAAYGAEGFIRGFIDLVFRKNGKYYIADWKSNWLEGGYRPADMEQCMDQAGYHLQYRLYSLALLRWLEKIEAKPETKFGGVFYLFLRGMEAGTRKGVYFVSPEKVGPRRELEENLIARMDRASVSKL